VTTILISLAAIAIIGGGSLLKGIGKLLFIGLFAFGFLLLTVGGA